MFDGVNFIFPLHFHSVRNYLFFVCALDDQFSSSCFFFFCSNQLAVAQLANCKYKKKLKVSKTDKIKLQLISMYYFIQIIDTDFKLFFFSILTLSIVKKNIFICNWNIHCIKINVRKSNVIFAFFAWQIIAVLLLLLLLLDVAACFFFCAGIYFSIKLNGSQRAYILIYLCIWISHISTQSSSLNLFRIFTHFFFVLCCSSDAILLLKYMKCNISHIH